MSTREFDLSTCYAALVPKDPFLNHDENDVEEYGNHTVYDFFDLINYVYELPFSKRKDYKKLTIIIVVPGLRQVALENPAIKRIFKRNDIEDLTIEEIPTSSDDPNIKFILNNWTICDVLAAPLASILKKLYKNESLQFQIGDEDIVLSYSEDDFYNKNKRILL